MLKHPLVSMSIQLRSQLPIIPSAAVNSHEMEGGGREEQRSRPIVSW